MSTFSGLIRPSETFPKMRGPTPAYPRPTTPRARLPHSLRTELAVHGKAMTTRPTLQTRKKTAYFTGYPYGGNALLAPCSRTTTRKKRFRGMTP